MAAVAGVPEHHLVREVLHCCQSISGAHVQLQGSGDTARFGCAPGAEVPAVQQQLIGKVGELGWLLCKVNDLTRQAGAARSVVGEAVVAAAQREVNNYYRLIAILEAQASGQAAAGGADAAAGSYLTLRRLEVWLSEPLTRLRVLARCLEATQGLAGGAAINALQALSKHGDPLFRGVVTPLLEAAAVPLLALLSHWVLDGRLPDADAGGADFFVVRGAAPALPKDGALHPAALWRTGFALSAAAQPAFVSGELAEAVLAAGKTIVFLREACGDAGWAALLEPIARAVPEQGSSLRQLRWLESAVGDARRAVSGHLLGIVMAPHALPAHLAALKQYLLLGQGDFARHLLDLSHEELDRPAADLSQFSLQGHLEAALRACSGAAAAGGAGGAWRDPGDVLRCLDVKLIPSMDGVRGWDTFSLQYHVDGPLAGVLSKDCMAVYNRIFCLLWCIKHAEQALASAWSAINDTQHMLGTLREAEREHGVDVPGSEAVRPVLRLCHAERAEMAQFVASLQSYISFEVVEPAWAALLAALPAAPDMDAVIAAHERALNDMAQGLFLHGMPHALVGSAPGGSATEVQSGLRATLRGVLDIQGPVRRLAAAVEAAVAEQRSYIARAQATERSGNWNEEVYNSPSISEDLLREVRVGLLRVSSSVRRKFHTFLSLLPAQAHLDLRFFLSRFDGAERGAGGAPDGSMP